MSRAIVLLSGGVDSAVSLAWAQSRYSHQLVAISFNYFLRPFRERLAVYRLLQKYPAQLMEPSISFLKEAGDWPAKASEKLPEGYISNRNMIFYSIAAYYAEMLDCQSIVGGHTAEDAEAFTDASTAFLQQLQQLINRALLQNKIQIEQPLIEMTKHQVMQRGIDWKIPLQHTWSCYFDAPRPCGRCISCVERAEAFRKIGVSDPLL